MKRFKRRHEEMPERRRVALAAETESASTSGTFFRRGRTLTGSASSLVRASGESRADLKSSRVQAHALVKKRRRLIGVFTVVFIVACVLYVLVSQFTARAVTQASPDPSLQIDTVYEEAIETYLGNHMGQRWRFMTDDTQLTRAVQAVAPEVASIRTLGSAGFGASSFKIVFREPIASWNINSRELYVDESGVPFERNYFTSPKLRITDQSGMVATDVGQSVMSNRFMGYIGQVISLAKQQGYTVEAIIIPEGMTRQITVTIEGVEYPIKFSSDRSAGEGVDDMVKTIQWMKARQLTPEYVDVRVDGRVFYRG